MLLKKKRSLLNSHILHLTFSLVGTVDSGHETSIIPNSTAFQDLLCDFEVSVYRAPLTHNACEPTEIRTLVCSCQRKLAYLALIKVLFHLNPSRLIKRRVCRYIFAFVRTGKGKKVFFWCWSVKELSYSVPEVCAARNELCGRVWVCSVCSSGLAARSLRAPSVSVRALHWTADRIQASVRRKFPWTRNRSHEE